jgi:copper chaperone NosL
MNPLQRKMAALFVLPITFLLASCGVSPEELDFGKDACAFCKMTVMDKKFGAEIINSKGKTLKFDSGECMMKYLQSDKTFKPEKYLIVNYENPGELVDAGKAFYLHGGNVNSPMGGKLAAFKSREAAEKVKAELHGDLILWSNVVAIKF